MTVLADALGKALGDWRTASASVLVLLAGLLAAQYFYSWYRLRHFKGPRLAAFSKLWLVRHVGASGTMHLEIDEVCKKYGPVARIGPNYLVTTDLEVIRRITAVRSPYRRADFYNGMRFVPGRDNVASLRNEDKHLELRGKLAAGYSGKENEHLEKALDHNVSGFIQMLDTKYVSTNSEYKPIDFARKTQYLTLDVISEVAFGKPFGFISTDSDVHGFIKDTNEILPAFKMVTTLPWLNYVMEMRVVRSLLPSHKDPFGFGRIMGFAKEVVAERFGPNKMTRRDMLGSFIRHGLTQEQAESESLLQIIAGSETTATAIRATVLHLITNPRVLSKFRDEISAASPSSPIQDIEARKLPYLQAIVKEGLRIYPPIASLMPKEVPPAGDIIHGVFVPGGTNIGSCVWGIFRDKNTWGEDAEVFRPERWLEFEGEKLREAELAFDMQFYSGRYSCLGKNIALMEIKKAIVELFRKFDFTLVNPTVPWKSPCNNVFTQTDMWVTLSRREDGFQLPGFSF